MEITFESKEEKKQFDEAILEIALVLDNINHKNLIRHIKQAEVEPDK